jgi:UDP-N-acetylglucosamine transferase subunit ALG13
MAGTFVTLFTRHVRGAGFMIFFSVGTESFPFDRLIRVADSLQDKLNGEKVFVQLGESRVIPEKCSWVKLLSFPKMVEAISEARIVVSHAGVGAMLLCARLGKVPVIVPRRKCFGEHLDDHQLELSGKMVEMGRAILAEQPEKVMELILGNRDTLRPAQSHLSSQPQLSDTILRYLTGADNLAGALPHERKV